MTRESSDLSVLGALVLLFDQLRRHGFLLGPDDLQALRTALRAGFGWQSPTALCRLCVALWAKTRREQALLEDLFAQLKLPQWALPPFEVVTEELSDSPGGEYSGLRPLAEVPLRGHQPAEDTPLEAAPAPEDTEPPAELAVKPSPALETIPPSWVDTSGYLCTLTPDYPLTFREVAQAWRRLRRPVRSGPLVELDVEGTIALRCRRGVATGVVLQPRRRNTARLLLLVDRRGSMTPFHAFVELVEDAILHAARFDQTACYYFHDVPVRGAADWLLTRVPPALLPVLDPILPVIPPYDSGTVYVHPDFHGACVLHDVQEAHAAGAFVVVISDAGAARGNCDRYRLLDTLAWCRSLYRETDRLVWLNPLPRAAWGASIAGQLARHVPMLPLDHEGLAAAVEILRTQRAPVERPL